MTDTHTDDTAGSIAQPTSLLAWCFNTLLKDARDTDTKNAVCWQLLAIGVCLECAEQRYAPGIPKMDELLDEETAYLIAHLIVTAAHWQPTPRESYFLNGAVIELVNNELNIGVP